MSRATAPYLPDLSHVALGVTMSTLAPEDNFGSGICRDEYSPRDDSKRRGRSTDLDTDDRWISCLLAGGTPNCGPGPYGTLPERLTILPPANSPRRSGGIRLFSPSGTRGRWTSLSGSRYNEITPCADWLRGGLVMCLPTSLAEQFEPLGVRDHFHSYPTRLADGRSTASAVRTRGPARSELFF